MPQKKREASPGGKRAPSRGASKSARSTAAKKAAAGKPKGHGGPKQAAKSNPAGASRGGPAIGDPNAAGVRAAGRATAPAAASAAIDALLDETREHPPAPEFTKQANVRDPKIYKDAERDLEAFWAKQAAELDWFIKWKRVLDWKVPDAKWFVGGKLNASYNCVDRHITGPRKNKAALIWIGEPGDRKTYTYWDLYRQVNKFANVLKSMGVASAIGVSLFKQFGTEILIYFLTRKRILVQCPRLRFVPPKPLI